MTREKWKDVVGYGGLYEVSNQGHVRSLDRESIDSSGRKRSTKGRMLKGSKRESGYRHVILYQGDSRKTKLVHRLVLEAFVGPAPKGMACRHLNGDPTDNRLENLAWGTTSTNNRDMVTHGTHRQSRKTHCPRGHKLDHPNLVPSSLKIGQRACLACMRARAYLRKYPESGELKPLSDEYYQKIMLTESASS